MNAIRVATVFFMASMVMHQASAPVYAGQTYGGAPFRRSLDDALNRLSRRMNVNILVDSTLIESRTVIWPGDSYSADDVLKAILAGTGLTYRYVDDRTIVIRPVTELKVAAPETAVVTGSHIRNVRPESLQLTTVAMGDLRKLGFNTIQQFSQRLLPNFSSIKSDSTVNNGDQPEIASNWLRGWALNLRGFGPGGTLVLLNGQRLAGGGSDGSFVDVSMLPLTAIDHVDVLMGGASALYGSDALAGVVNFISLEPATGGESWFSFGGPQSSGVSDLLVGQRFGQVWMNGSATLTYEYGKQLALDAEQLKAIPRQAGPFMVFPLQVRNSVFTSIEQALWPDTRLRTDVLLGERKFSQSFTSGPVSTESSGRARQLSASTELLHEFLSNDWQAGVSLHRAIEEELVTNSSVAPDAGVNGQPVPFKLTSTLSALEIRSDGPLPVSVADDLRLSAGAGVRREEFNYPAEIDISGPLLSRNVAHAYGELNVPLVSKGTRRLDLSLAARYDRYWGRNGGRSHAISPKYALFWAPASAVNVRGSFSQSFADAPLGRFNDASNTAIILPVQRDAQDKRSVLLILGGNRDLHPEKSRTYTFGVDIFPSVLPGLKLSASYYDFFAKERIAVPPMQGSPADVLAQYDQLAPYIKLSPSPAEIENIYPNYSTGDLDHLGAQNIEAIFDGRVHNIAQLHSRGFDLSLASKLQGWARAFEVHLDAGYLMDLTYRLAPGAPAIDLAGTAFNPGKLHIQGGLDWTLGQFSSSMLFDFYDAHFSASMEDADPVGAWNTVDLSLRYEFAAVEGAMASFNIYNVFDKNPPFLATSVSLGYDPTNSSPLGRFFGFQVIKQW